jgi:hypothetical protein
MLMAVAKINLFIVIIAKMKLQLFLRRTKMINLEQEEKKMNPLAHAVYDQVIEEFISGDTSCFFQTLCQIEDLNNPSIKEFMQGYLKENEDE